jgi:hypothetical protein
MHSRARRGVAAAGTVAVAAAVNVATGMLTQHWAWAWWAATAVLVVVGGGLQAWLTVGHRAAGASGVSASGEGSIAGAGPVTKVSTKVTRPPGPARPPLPGPAGARSGVSASGLGAIASGEGISDAHTEVSGEGAP